MHITTDSVCYTSTRTVRDRFQHSGMSARCPLFYLPLTGSHSCLRCLWFYERRRWNDIVFNDESISTCNISMVGFEFGHTVGRGF
ncbi:hypothetical protein TNCV_521641 [Trichonephila clavipes]|nr:hypothetical protein TNCV_521641 [Trichonephila clavipes]